MSHNQFNNCIPTDDIILLEDEAEEEMLARALEESLRYNVLHLEYGNKSLMTRFL
jgi:hypothetical protein